ncbi:MAG: PH domain-containing protein [Hyphomonadaceae bacterium]
MSYVERALTAGETVKFKAKIHWIIWLRAWAALILFGVLLFGIVIFVRDLVFMLTTEVAVTNSRLIKKWGWPGLHTSELELSSVEAVSVDQTLWGRLFGYGRVQIHGTGDDVWSSPLIAAPVQFRREVESALLASTARAASVTA